MTDKQRFLFSLRVLVGRRAVLARVSCCILIVGLSVAWMSTQITAQTTTPPFTPQWSSFETGLARSVAWGDMDGDGDPDLAIGNYGYAAGEPNRLYRNDGGLLTPQAVWSSTEADETTSIAWGDVDGDGDLDLAVGNDWQPNQLYRNDAGTLTSTAAWSSYETDPTICIEWGDYDGDGDPDLAAGNPDGHPLRLYRNDGGQLVPTAAWSSVETEDASDLAWGDIDRDEDLDLVVGGIYGNRLYRNDDGSLTLIWKTTVTEYTTSVDLADVDGDEDLDLAAGNAGYLLGYGQPNRVYRNEGGTFSEEAIWSSSEQDYTYSIVWGDYDNDGDPDLAVGNYGQHSRLYRNVGGKLVLLWSFPEQYDTTSIAWGDVDGDGDLDLAIGVGTSWYPSQPSHLYRNEGVRLTPRVFLPILLSNGS